MKALYLIIVVTLAGIAGAQPATAPAGDRPPDTGSASPPASGSASGSDATEPTFEPTRISAASTPQASAEPLLLDELRIGGSDRVELFMFGDASAIAASGVETGFQMGDLGLQITTHLATGLVGRMESMVTYNTEFGTSIDMERMYIEYRRAGWAIAGGRTHAELGYWNNAFHHGRWLQLTIARPHVLRFEDEEGILPIHHVGFAVVHSPPRGERGIEVALGVSNGHGPTMLGIQNLGDDNHAKAVLLRVGVVGLLNDTLRFGANAAVDKMKGYPEDVYPLLPGSVMNELITGLYLALRGDPLILFSEVYDIRHTAGCSHPPSDPNAPCAWNTLDGFVIAGYRLGQLIPYAQFETRLGDIAKDPFYHPNLMFQPEAVTPGNFVEAMLGLHYDLSAWSALKLELAANTPEGKDTQYRVELNWSFGR